MSVKPSRLPTEPRSVLRGPRTARGRSWLLLACATILVLIYLVVWTTFSLSRTVTRFEQLTPGAAAFAGPTQFRVLSIEQSTELASDDPKRSESAPAGSTYVLAEVEVLQSAEDPNFICVLTLVGTHHRQWETASGVYLGDRNPPSYCNSADVVVGKPYRYLSIYEVPTAMADEFYGLALNSYSGKPSLVISPPRQ